MPVRVRFAHEPVTGVTEGRALEPVLLGEQGLAFGVGFGPVVHLASVVQFVSRLLEFTTNSVLLVLLVLFPLGDAMVVIEVFVDNEIVVFQ